MTRSFRTGADLQAYLNMIREGETLRDPVPAPIAPDPTLTLKAEIETLNRNYDVLDKFCDGIKMELDAANMELKAAKRRYEAIMKVLMAIILAMAVMMAI